MDCKDCLNMRDLERRVKTIEDETKDIKESISELKIEHATSKEQMKTIFKTLTEIKESIKIIGDQLAELKNKPADAFDKIKLSAATAVVGVLIGALAGKIF